MCGFAASAIYPDPTFYSFGDLIKWAQPRIASGTALPAVASAAEGDIFVLKTDPASPSINILLTSAWRTISGGSGGGSSTSVTTATGTTAGPSGSAVAISDQGGTTYHVSITFLATSPGNIGEWGVTKDSSTQFTVYNTGLPGIPFSCQVVR